METLQITVSLDVAQAINNARELADALRQLRGAADGMGTSVSSAEQRLAALGSTTGSTSPQLSQLATVTQAASNNFNQFNTQVNVANSTEQTFNQTTNQAVINITNVAAQTRQAEQATSGLLNQVQSLVATYFGIQGVIHLMQELIDQMRRVREAQNSLTDQSFDFGSRIQTTMANLGLQGQAGEARARRLVLDVSAGAHVGSERAADALEVTNASGMDVVSRGKEGDGGRTFATELAAFGERRQFDKEDLLQFARTLVQRGIKDSQGLKEAEAKFDAQFVNSLETSPTMYMRGLVGVLSAETAKGVDTDYAASLYTAMVARTRNTLRAQMSTKAVFDLASASDGKTGAFFAHKAAEMGVTHVDGVGDSELEAIIESRGKSGELSPKEVREARSVFSERQAIQRRHDHIDLEKQDFASKSKDRGVRRLSANDRQRRQRDFDEKIRLENEAIDRESRKIEDQLDELREQEQSRREQAAYRSVSAQARVQKVIIPAAAGAMASDAQRNAFVQGTGGVIARDDALFLVSTSAAQQDIQKVQQVAKAASAADTDKAREAFRQTTAGKLAYNASTKFIREEGAVDQGMKQDRLLDQQAESQQKVDAAKGKFDLTFSDILSDPIGSTYNAFSKDRQIAGTKNKLLREQINAYIKSPDSTAVEKAQAQAMLKELDDEDVSMSNISTTHVNDYISRVAQNFGSLKSATDARAANGPATNTTAPPSGAGTPTPAPASSAKPGFDAGTQTDADTDAIHAYFSARDVKFLHPIPERPNIFTGPAQGERPGASAAPVINYHTHVTNHHIGAVFSQGDDIFEDLPGGLSGWG